MERYTGGEAHTEKELLVGTLFLHLPDHTALQIKEELDILDESFSDSLWPIIPSTVRERGPEEKGQYTLTFMANPVFDKISPMTFFEGVSEYASLLKDSFSQEQITFLFQDQHYQFSSPSMQVEDETHLRELACSYLKRGRPHWDVPHTMETVRWIKLLAQAEGGNLSILTPAMYLHDVGWGGMFDDQPCNLTTIHAGVKQQARQSVERAEAILRTLHRPEQEIGHILRLIEKHDDIDSIESPYETLVMEADTLGQLSTPQNDNFGSEDYRQFISYVRNKRVPKFKTLTGRKHLEELLEGK